MMVGNEKMKGKRKKRIYERYMKRPIDFILALMALIVLSPLLLFLTIIGACAMKENPFFVQPRPGLNEKIFNLVKFRTMSNAKDKGGNILPDEVRLNKYGKYLRSTSLDELPELWNILKGELSFCGPRPQLVRDMVFMTDHQRMRHTAKPGLTGLAQVKGRNAITWEEKLNWDLKYIERVTFWGDLKILFETVIAVFKRSGITDGENATALDYGDTLLKTGKVSQNKYDILQVQAKKLIEECEKRK